MAKLELTIENFDKVCASIERRGATLQTDIQNATLLAVEFWHAHNRNPRYITQLYRAVHNTRGLSAARLERYITAHVPVVLTKVKGEIKFANDDDANELFGDTRLGDMLKVSWVDFKPESNDPEFDLEKAALALAKKVRKNGVDRAKAEAVFHAALAQLDKDMAKAVGNATTAK